MDWALSGRACSHKERPVQHIEVRSTHIIKGFLLFLSSLYQLPEVELRYFRIMMNAAQPMTMNHRNHSGLGFILGFPCVTAGRIIGMCSITV